MKRVTHLLALLNNNNVLRDHYTRMHTHFFHHGTGANVIESARLIYQNLANTWDREAQKLLPIFRSEKPGTA
jgi:hypothetical protein